MEAENRNFELYLAGGKNPEKSGSASSAARAVRKFSARLNPGQTRYVLEHGLGTENVIVQTRIAGNIREGGVSILDAERVCITFGGTLNEAMDVVIMG
jgi:hypothetical protein